MIKLIQLVLISILVLMSVASAATLEEEKIAYENSMQEYQNYNTEYSNARKNYYFATGAIVADYGDSLYIFGTFAQIDTMANGSSDCNIKIINTPRQFVKDGAYNYYSDRTSDLPHRFIRTAVTYNSWGNPLPLYILEYDADADREITRLKGLTDNAYNKANMQKKAYERRLKAEKEERARQIQAKADEDYFSKHSSLENGIYLIKRIKANPKLIYENREKPLAILSLDFLAQAVKEDINRFAACYYMGYLSHLFGQYDDAIEMYRYALGEDLPKKLDDNLLKEYYKDHPAGIVELYRVYLNIGHLLGKSGDYETALKYLIRAKRLAPNNRDVLWEIALTYDARGWLYRKDAGENYQYYYATLPTDKPFPKEEGDRPRLAEARRLEPVSWGYRWQIKTDISREEYLKWSKWNWEPK